jgi:hypothetical protein
MDVMVTNVPCKKIENFWQFIIRTSSNCAKKIANLVSKLCNLGYADVAYKKTKSL